MVITILLMFVVKSAIAAVVWSGELGDICYKAALHVRALERRPFTPAEDKFQRAAMKQSAWFVLALPVVGSLCATLWPGIALPRGGNFDGAESFRGQVRRICARALLLDVPLAAITTAHVVNGVLIK